MPFNRIVAFVGPYISIVAGAVASWLLLHVHILGTFHFGHDQIASAIAQVLVFAVSTGVVWAGHQKWLTGHQKWFETFGHLTGGGSSGITTTGGSSAGTTGVVASSSGGGGGTGSSGAAVSSLGPVKPAPKPKAPARKR